MTNEDRYIEKTLCLMCGLGISVRDTFDPLHNFDDYYSNGRRSNGPRLFRITWDAAVPYPQARFRRKYWIPGHAAVAYDAFVIKLPECYRTNERDDPLIHECVHFLQHNTLADLYEYIEFNGANYTEYIAQRIEFEAHLVQAAYILDVYLDYVNANVEPSVHEHLHDLLGRYRAAPDAAVGWELVLGCKSCGLI